jgi:oxaloacetate decarboxylase beta subunit
MNDGLVFQAVLSSLGTLTEGFQTFGTVVGWQNLIMIGIASVLLYLGVKKGVEPLLLVPIGFGCFIANIPLNDVMQENGVLREFYNMGIVNELFPLLIFVGIGSMIDFSPLIADPKTILFGAAGQLGIFSTLCLALMLGFDQRQAACIGSIGACDGPTVIYVSNLYAPELLGTLSVAAYSYMALVPILQPPIMRLFTSRKEREVLMPFASSKVNPVILVLFPLVVTLLVGLIAPKGLPLMAMIMLGNFMKVTGVVSRLTKASENEIANISTLLLGLAIGGTMQGEQFLKWQTLLIFGLGLLAIIVDTAGGIWFGKIWYLLSGGKVNPLIGAAGISAYPMAARLVQNEGQKYNKNNYLLMRAAAANTGGQVGSIVAASIMLAILHGMKII